MILSSAYQTPAGALLAGTSLLSILAYGFVALTSPKPQQTTVNPQFVMLLAWCAHLLALLLEISGIGQATAGARFGFAPALSTTVWLVIAVYMLESRLLPLLSVRRILAVLAVAGLGLALLFPGESRPLAASPWAPIHWVLGLASYGLFGVAVLHAALLNRAERQMRHVKQGVAGGQTASHEPLMPLLRLERLTFQFVGAGVSVLSLAVLVGWWFTPHWHWDHKNLFAVLGWLVLSGLLAGRRVFGWRGRRATRWLYFGALLLLLSYAGSRFVLEVVLQRPL